MLYVETYKLINVYFKIRKGRKMSKETENLKLFKWDTTSETDLNNKFDIEKTDPINIRDEHFEKLFDEAKEKHPLTSEMRNKLEELDQYIIEHFRINNDMLTSAAISRHFSACFQVILSCPNTQEWKEEYRMLKSEIETYAPCVKRDKNARLRNRIIACIAQKNTDLAICLCKYIYKHRN